MRGARLVMLATLVGCSSSGDPGAAPPDAAGADGAVDAPYVSDGGADASDASSRPLRVMTWNLETYPLTSSTPALVAQVIANELPDVVAVQEVSDASAFSKLPQALPEGYQAVVADTSGSFFTLGILYNEHRVAIGAPENLFADDAYTFPRAPFKVKVLALGVGDGSFDFTLVNVHLKAQLDPESVARRKAACLKLAQWVEAGLAQGAETDFVLAGDFNDELQDQPADNVFLPFLDNSATYRFLTYEAAAAGEHTYLPFDSMIDHVLVTTDVLAEYGAGTTNILELDQTISGYQASVSDHRPVVVDFGAP